MFKSCLHVNQRHALRHVFLQPGYIQGFRIGVKPLFFKSILSLPSFSQHSYLTTLKNRFRIVAGIILSRPPHITRTPHPFEQAYFDYQEKLIRQTALPFPGEFYFKKGSVAERKWNEEEALRQKVASLSTPVSFGEALKDTDIEGKNKEDFVVQKASRITEADRVNDRKSLDRALDRTLYLLVKKPREEHAWQFPQGGLEEKEYLHEAAQRELNEECGRNMDVWFVGRVPAGHYVYKYSKEFIAENKLKTIGAKVFFMRAHIFSGQVKPDTKEIVDFVWVTKQEIKEYVTSEYWQAVKDILNEL